MFKKTLLATSVSLSLLLQGCGDLTMQPSPLTNPAKQQAAQQQYQIPGHVYVLRGFLGIFSRGMDTLSVRCNKELGISSMSLAALDWSQLGDHIIEERELGRLSGPIILIGHSQGADKSIQLAYKLQQVNIPVDMLVLIGPFAPSPVPANVKYVLNLDRSYVVGKVLPFMGNVTVKVADPSKTRMETLDLGYTKADFDSSSITHFNIDKSHEVQNLVMVKIRELATTNPV